MQSAAPVARPADLWVPNFSSLLALFLLHDRTVIEPAGLILAGPMPAAGSISTPQNAVNMSIPGQARPLSNEQREFTCGQRLVTL